MEYTHEIHFDLLTYVTIVNCNNQGNIMMMLSRYIMVEMSKGDAWVQIGYLNLGGQGFAVLIIATH
jgi:hypothetical protein